MQNKQFLDECVSALQMLNDSLIENIEGLIKCDGRDSAVSLAKQSIELRIDMLREDIEFDEDNPYTDGRDYCLDKLDSMIDVLMEDLRYSTEESGASREYKQSFEEAMNGILAALVEIRNRVAY